MIYSINTICLHNLIFLGFNLFSCTTYNYLLFLSNSSVQSILRVINRHKIHSFISTGLEPNQNFTTVLNLKSYFSPSLVCCEWEGSLHKPLCFHSVSVSHPLLTAVAFSTVRFRVTWQHPKSTAYANLIGVSICYSFSIHAFDVHVVLLQFGYNVLWTQTWDSLLLQFWSFIRI